MKKIKKSVASELFRELFVPPWSCRKIARALGCSKSTVACWMRGDVIPSPEVIAALRVLLKVKLSESWTKRDRSTVARSFLPRFTRHYMADALGRSMQSIVCYATGRMVPSTEIALAIEKLAPEVRVPDWFVKL